MTFSFQWSRYADEDVSEGKKKKKRAAIKIDGAGLLSVPTVKHVSSAVQ